MNAELIQEIGRFIEKNYIVIAIVLGAFVQVSPIKIYPLDLVKKILKWIGAQLMIDVDKKLDSIEHKVDDMECEFDKKRIKDLRFEILDFDNAITRRSYGRESYEHVMFDIHQEYEQLLEKYEMKNGKVDRAMKRISESYDKRIADDPQF